MSETFLILRMTERDININIHVFMQSTVYSCKIIIKLEFLDRFKKKLKYYFIKIRNVGAELFHVDGQTDRHDKMKSLFFCNFANVHKKSLSNRYSLVVVRR